MLSANHSILNYNNTHISYPIWYFKSASSIILALPSYWEKLCVPILHNYNAGSHAVSAYK